jgi:2-polyprenyl-3-methyl-5-hydroxy-6-metoxy-1,4-benzoquinol methylase
MPTHETLAAAYSQEYLPHVANSALTGSAYENLNLRAYLKEHHGYTHLQGYSSIRMRLPLSNLWYQYNVGSYLMPDYVENGKLLDVGCGNGSRLSGLQSLGWKDLHGIEMSTAAAQRASALGFKIHCGPVEALAKHYPDSYFDVITCTTVLEHLEDPFGLIKQIALKLKPQGQFLFSTVDRDGIDFRMFGPYARTLDLPRHLVWFQKKDILQMLSGSFDHVEMFYQREVADFVWSARMRAKESPHWIDSLIIAMGEKNFRFVSALVALMKMTSRVSVRCRRCGPSTGPQS